MWDGGSLRRANEKEAERLRQLHQRELAQERESLRRLAERLARNPKFRKAFDEARERLIREGEK